MLGAAERFEESWRRQNEENFRYYDGDQWTAEEMQALRLRGQPPVVVNMVGAMIDMVRSLQIYIFQHLGGAEALTDAGDLQ